MSEANIAEAELAKVIAKREREQFIMRGLIMNRVENFCGHSSPATCEFSECDECAKIADDIAQHLAAAGYRKRSDVLEECWLKALGDETNSAIPLELATNKDAMKGIEFITMQIANSIRSLKGQP